mmetsp:Transcript_387/g.1129  ORF Transcript_387/g.1129 Transcript_387/m.1129 type:complete len:92 (+) Transcript_387:151-426(+)
MCASTMYIMAEFGGEGGEANAQTKTMKPIMKGMAGVSLIVTAWFPAAMFCYWVPSNVISLANILVFRVPAMKKLFGFADAGTRSSFSHRLA